MASPHGAYRSCVPDERGHQPFLGDHGGAQLEDGGTHLGQCSACQLPDLLELLLHSTCGADRVSCQRPLSRFEMKRRGEERLCGRIVQVTGDALALLRGALALAAPGLGEIQGSPSALADDCGQAERGK